MATESKSIQLATPCPDFNLMGVDEKTHSLSSYSDKKLLVVGFTCNHCPYVQAYEARLNALIEAFKGQSIGWICINSNDESTYPEDSFVNMKLRAQEKGFLWDYLRDESQKVARAFNAACTPEFYVYNESRILVYHGRIDDSPKDPKAVKQEFLKEVLKDLLANKVPRFEQTSAIGCSIKWKS